MLTVRCAKCKSKLMKYEKIGTGKVLKCFKERTNLLDAVVLDGKLSCPCGNVIGEERGSYYHMKQGQFVYSGTKITG